MTLLLSLSKHLHLPQNKEPFPESGRFAPTSETDKALESRPQASGERPKQAVLQSPTPASKKSEATSYERWEPHSARRPVREVTHAIKLQLPRSDYIHQTGMRVIHFLDQNTGLERYRVSEAQDQATYCKIKYGRMVDAKGRVDKAARVAIREMRLPEGIKPAPFGKFKRPKTVPRPESQALRDAQRTRSIRDAIDQHLERHIISNQGQDPFKALRSNHSHFEVFDVVKTEDKIHVVTSLESGDIFSIKAFMPISLRANISLSISAQVVDEVAAMHESGWAHLDIKDENVLFLPTGQVKVCDLGDCLPIDKATGSTHYSGLWGSVPTLEMMGHDERILDAQTLQSPALTPATDVYCLGVMGVNLLVHHYEKEPIDYGPFAWIADAQGVRDLKETRRHLNRFESWRQNVLLPNGGLDGAVLKDGSIFGKFFSKIHALDSGQTELWLRFALCAKTEDRASAAFLASRLKTLVAKMSPQAGKDVQSFFRVAHDELGQEDIFTRLDKYDTLIQERGGPERAFALSLS